jgi:small-conductance mechanosensitive channel
MAWIGRLLTERRPRNTPRSLALWIIALLAVGTALLLAFAASLGFFALGVALAARLVFVLILVIAVLPWLRPRGG